MRCSAKSSTRSALVNRSQRLLTPWSAGAKTKPRRSWVNLAVEQLDQHYSTADVSAVVAQLVRSAVHQELLRLNRDMREGRVSPEMAMATIRDVKEREELLESAQGDVAEGDLRHWLVERASLTSS